MNHADTSAEWEKLCEEHEAARVVYLQSFENVNHKFAAIGQGKSNKNPSEDELSSFDKTWKVWGDLKKRMKQFIKDNT